MRFSASATALATALFAVINSVHAADLTLVVPVAPSLPNPSTLPPTTHATLHAKGRPLVAPLTRSNTFEFRDVLPGSYLLTVHCRDFAFETERVDVTVAVAGAGASAQEKVEVWQTFRGHEWDNKGESRGTGVDKAVAEVRVIGVKSYYQEKGGFSPLAFLKNPMILMALFSLAIIVGLPYLTDNMDPETRAEFEEMQKKGVLGTGGNPASQIQNFDLAGWMAGKTSTTEGGSTAAEVQSSGSKKKKR